MHMTLAHSYRSMHYLSEYARDGSSYVQYNSSNSDQSMYTVLLSIQATFRLVIILHTM